MHMNHASLAFDELFLNYPVCEMVKLELPFLTSPCVETCQLGMIKAVTVFEVPYNFFFLLNFEHTLLQTNVLQLVSCQDH